MKGLSGTDFGDDTVPSGAVSSPERERTVYTTFSVPVELYTVFPGSVELYSEFLVQKNLLKNSVDDLANILANCN